MKTRKPSKEFEEFFDKASRCIMYRRFDQVYYISISVAARLTGRDRATVRKAVRAAGLYPEKGPRNAELYKSYQILRAIATGRD
jgi:hypothetical protein